MSVHPKVKASTAGAAVAGVLVWVLNRYVFHGSMSPGYAAEIDAAVPAVLAFIAGWLTPSPRPAPAPAPVASIRSHEM